MSRQNSKFQIPNSGEGVGSLSEIFAKRLHQLGIKRQVDAALVCEAFDKAVFEVFGEAGRKNVRAISFKNNTLKVAAAASSWASEVSLKQLELTNGQEIRIVYETREPKDIL